MPLPLPIDAVLQQVTSALARGTALVLQAEPGAGKTTRVPLALLGQSWVQGKKIVMLEPRRLAARAAATFMSESIGEHVGERVGYRIRGEARTSERTELEVVTEGILTRYLQHDPSLENVACVIFDEFHERSIHSDLGLALSLETSAALRPDLRLLVMSATMDTEGVAKMLGGAPVISCPGRVHPIENRYLDHRAEGRIEAIVAPKVRQALKETEGHILVFLAGRGEILNSEEVLLRDKLPEDVELLKLSSEVEFSEQKKVLFPAPEGKRRVILATNIAETSLTIDGVRVVIDSGWMRIPYYDPRRGLPGLKTSRVSLASAEQRRGRAGRQAPGVCYRLWTKAEEQDFPRYNQPEILQSDLASFCLELAVWGVDPLNVSLLDYPTPAALSQQNLLLKEIGALDKDGRATPHGREIASLGVHPRLGNMLLRSKKLGLGPLACDVAALLDDRDILRGREVDVDLQHRWQLLNEFRRSTKSRPGSHGRLGRIARHAGILCKRIGCEGAAEQLLGDLGLVVALAFPDRIAKRREAKGKKYLLVNGTGASLPEQTMLDREEYLAIAELDASGADSRIFIAEPISEEEIRNHFGCNITTERKSSWEAARNTFSVVEAEQLGAITLSSRLVQPELEDMQRAYVDYVKSAGVSVLPWDRETSALRSRSEWVRKTIDGITPWPDLSDEGLRESLDEWLYPFVKKGSSGGRVRAALPEALLSLLGWERARRLEELAPKTIILPSGREVRVDYERGDKPLVSVPLQWLFGCSKSLNIGGGRQPLLLELLSPAGRPLQVTSDLESFWRNSYKEVRKEMLGRYPKHPWPEDPASAKPPQSRRRVG